MDCDLSLQLEHSGRGFQVSSAPSVSLLNGAGWFHRPRDRPRCGFKGWPLLADGEVVFILELVRLTQWFSPLSEITNHNFPGPPLRDSDSADVHWGLDRHFIYKSYRCFSCASQSSLGDFLSSLH